MQSKFRPSLLATLPLLLLTAGCGSAGPTDEGPPALSVCADPLPVQGTYTPEAPGYIVMYRPGTDAAVETAVLAERYDFTPNYVYQAVGGFAALLEPAAVEGLRCEPSVLIIEHDGIVTIAR